MQRIALDAPAGRVSDELARRGIAAETPVRVLVEILTGEDLPITALAHEARAFDVLAEEPELYTDADAVERTG